MRKRYRQLFYVPQHGKVQDNVMLARAVWMVAAVILCLTAMGLTAYAYFSHTITSAANTIKSANFMANLSVQSKDPAGVPVEISKTERNQLKVFLKANETYTFIMDEDPSSTAKTGFCIISAEGCATTYHTQQLGVDAKAEGGFTDKIIFELTVTADTTIFVVSHWGTSSHYVDQTDACYITNKNVDGDKIVMHIGDDDNKKEDSLAELEKKYTFHYYADPQQVLTEAYQGTLGMNPTAERENANAAAYIDENGTPWLVFLKDQTLDGTLVVCCDININLGGHNLKTTANTFLMQPQNHPSTVTIEGVGSIVEASVRAIECWDGSRLTVNGGTFIGWTGNAGQASASTAILNRGIATLNHVHAIGLHAGLMVDGTAGTVTNINGGTYQGYSSGGIFFGGTSARTYVKDATIEQIDILDGYGDAGMNNNGHGACVGGNHNVIYMDNCIVKGLPGAVGAIRFQTSDSETGNRVYMSNMTLLPGGITMGQSHRLYVGSGCGEVNCGEELKSTVIYTNDSYRLGVGEDIVHKVLPGEVLTQIAGLYQTTVARLAVYNGIADPDVIHAGWEIKIPPDHWQMPENGT